MQKYSTCTGCALQEAPMAKNECVQSADVVIVGGFPLQDDCKKAPFAAYKSAIVKQVVFNILARVPAWQKPVVAYTYATMCCPESIGWKVDAETAHRCSANLLAYLDRMHPKVVIAMGAAAAKALGIKGSQSDMRGGMYTVRLSSGDETRCFVTHHIAQVDKIPGLFPVMQNDIGKALNYAMVAGTQLDMEIETAVAFDDVMALLDKAEAELTAAVEACDGTPRTVPVAIDTETTSVLPWHPDSRMIAISMAYKKTAGLAFPVEHLAAGYTPEQTAKILSRVQRMLGLPKISVVMNNGKFDVQWLNYKYGLGLPLPEHDTMLLEHILEEDKKGEYSLKDIIRDRFPELGGYEGDLHKDLDSVYATRCEEAKEVIATLKEELVQIVSQWWTGITTEKRSNLLASWVDAGYLMLSETGDMADIKFRKLKGKLTITKKYMTQVIKLVNKVPVEALQQADPDFAEAVAGTMAATEKASVVPASTFEDIEIDKLLTYAAIDAYGTRRVFGNQMARSMQDDAIIKSINSKRSTPLETKPMLHPYKHITMPLCHTLTDMEYNGIRVDRDKLHQYVAIVQEKLALKLDEMYTEIGYKFNTSSSSPDLSRILYEELGLPVLKTTDTGAPSTDADTLKELFDRHDAPFLKTILAYRKMDKCLNTYLLGWLNKSAVDGKIHCSYNQIGTATYRLSSSNPNLQNVPFYLKEADLNLKALFIPDSEEYDFYDLDISNAEMRVLTAYSLDPTLISVFNEGKDIHCLTAAGISDYTYDEIYEHKENKETDYYSKRQVAKKVNFGTIYVMGAATLKAKLWADMRIEVTEEEAQAYLDKFFVTYPGVANYINQTQEFVEKYRFSYTFTGRRRRFPYAAFSRAQVRRVGRQAVNARIQTTSADLVGMNIIEVDRAIRPLGGRVLITVHDSIGFQLPKGTTGVKALLDQAIPIGIKEQCPWLPVEWKYDAGMGPNYGDAHGAVN